MLKLTKIHLIKILSVYAFLALAAFFCYNTTLVFGAPRKRAFRCFDETLNKPFVPDTVPHQQLYLLGIYFPIAFIAVCELCCSLKDRQTLTNTSWLIKYFLKCGILLTLFGIGLAVERSLKNIGKIKMSRLRPNFLSVCDPMNTEGLKCADLDETAIMMDYQCTTNSYPSWALRAVHVSFPSSHTSLVAYAMIFLIGYLSSTYRKFQQSKSPTAIVILLSQVFCLLASVFVGVSRVLDFRHHWTDVFAGFLLGSSLAIALSWYMRQQWENIDNWLHEIMGLTTIEISKSAEANASDVNRGTRSSAIEMNDV